MKRQLMGLVLAIVLTASVSAQQILVDIGDASMTTASPDVRGMHWNNAVWDGPGGNAPLPLVDSKGNATPFRLIRASGFLGAFTTGDNEQDIYPPTAAKDRWSLEKGKVEEGVIRVTGLGQNDRVSFTCFAVRDAPVPFFTKFAALGQEAVINAQNNRKERARLKGLRPDMHGKVDLRVSIESGPNGHFSVLVISVEKVQEAPPVSKPAAPLPPQPKPIQPEPTPQELNDRQAQLEDLGLTESNNSTLFMVVGIVMILLGLGIVSWSVWYYLKPEPVAEQADEG